MRMEHISVSQLGTVLPHNGHLVMSGDISHFIAGEGKEEVLLLAFSRWKLGVHPAMHRTAPPHTHTHTNKTLFNQKCQ